MVFTVYLGYSQKDERIANSLYSILKQNGIDVYAVGMEYFADKKDISSLIRNYMQKSDLIIFILNENNIKSPNFIYEIGMANGMNKEIISILDPFIHIPVQLQNTNYIVLDKNAPEESLNNIINYSMTLKNRKYSNQAFGILLLLGALALIVSKDDQSSE